MTTIQTFESGTFVATFDVLTGAELLACPTEGADAVRDPSADDGRTTADASFAAVLTELCGRGIEPHTDAFGCPEFDAPLPDGRQVLGLYLHDAVTGAPGFAEIAAGARACRDALVSGSTGNE